MKKTYLVLLRRRREDFRQAAYPIDELAVTEEEGKCFRATVESHNVEPLDIITSLGLFQIILICRAGSTENLRTLLDELAENWHTDTLLASSHTRWEFVDTDTR